MPSLENQVYDGDTVTVTPHDTADSLDLRLESHGGVCATGRAALPQEPVVYPPRSPRRGLGHHARPTGNSQNEATLPVGAWLAIHPFRISSTEAAQYLRDVRENLSLYADERPVQSGAICTSANRHCATMPRWHMDACRQ